MLCSFFLLSEFNKLTLTLTLTHKHIIKNTTIRCAIKSYPQIHTQSSITTLPQKVFLCQIPLFPKLPNYHFHADFHGFSYPFLTFPLISYPSLPPIIPSCTNFDLLPENPHKYTNTPSWIPPWKYTKILKYPRNIPKYQKTQNNPSKFFSIPNIKEYRYTKRQKTNRKQLSNRLLNCLIAVTHSFILLTFSNKKTIESKRVRLNGRCTYSQTSSTLA